MEGRVVARQEASEVLGNFLLPVPKAHYVSVSKFVELHFFIGVFFFACML